MSLTVDELWEEAAVAESLHTIRLAIKMIGLIVLIAVN
jgi:hypothetical protein